MLEKRRGPAITLLGACWGLLAAMVGLGLLAPTASAAPCANASIRASQGAQHLPNCRAYERVSPADAETNRAAGIGVSFTPMVAKAAANGERVMYTSTVAVGDATRAAFNSISVSSRGANGWHTFGTLTTAGEVDFDLGGHAPVAPYMADDASRVAFRTARGLGGPNPGTNNGGSAYLSAVQGIGPPAWLSEPMLGGPIPGSGSGQALIVGGSSDLSTVFFTFQGQLTDLYGDDLRTGLGTYMYRNGVITPAGRLPSGDIAPGGTFAAGAGQASVSSASNLSPAAARKSVSRDGSRFFFVSPASGPIRQLYVQQDGEPGRLITKDLNEDPAPDGVSFLSGPTGSNWNQIGNGFAFPTPDGETVVFRSASALTADAPGGTDLKTYRAQVSDDEITLEYLEEVSGVPMGMSEAAEQILFVDNVGGGSGTLKFWDENRPGGVPYTLASIPWSSDHYTGLFNVRVTPDGSAVLFDSSLEVIPGLVMPGLAGAVSGTTQVYRWEVGDAQPTCISCRKDGGPFGRFGAKSANLGQIYTDSVAYEDGKSPDGFNQGSLSHQQGISDDGSRVFFDAIDPLDPVRDTNGQRDVYMWEDGEVHLLTSGKGKAPSYLIDSSATGDDVFFTTMDGLVPEDVNGDYDVYTARVGGGFETAMVDSCTGDTCQGEFETSPALPVLGSVSFGGDGNLRPGTPKARASVRVGRLKVVSGPIARLRVRVPRAGRIAVNGRLIKRSARAASKAGAYSVRIALSPRARKALAKRKRVKVAARVTFRARGGQQASKRIRVTFKQPQRARAGKGGR